MSTSATPRFVIEFTFPDTVRIVERLIEGPGCDSIELRLSESGRLEAGMEIPAADFLREVELSKFAVRSNKHAVVTQLPTWYWVAVVGDNGEMRGKPHLVRHTLPGPEYGPAARFELCGEVVNPGTQWWRMRYFLRRAPAATVLS